MKKLFVLSLWVCLLAGVLAGDITPYRCTDEGGPGPAELVSIQVSYLSGSPPYTMYTNTEYTCNITFIAANTVAEPKYKIFATVFQLGSIPVNVFIVNKPVAAFNAGDTVPVSADFTIPYTALNLTMNFYGVVSNGQSNTNEICLTGEATVYAKL